MGEGLIISAQGIQDGFSSHPYGGRSGDAVAVAEEGMSSDFPFMHQGAVGPCIDVLCADGSALSPMEQVGRPSFSGQYRDVVLPLT